MTNPLSGMTQGKWDALSPAEREHVQDLSGLTPQLIGLEGWRVEVTAQSGKRRRFIVARSTGWRPCHIEMPRRGVYGGFPADSSYLTVRKLYFAR